MSEQWFRFFALLITQGVILAGLWFNRKPKLPVPQVQTDTMRRIERKVDKLDESMIRHLEMHGGHGNPRRGW